LLILVNPKPTQNICMLAQNRPSPQEKVIPIKKTSSTTSRNLTKVKLRNKTNTAQKKQTPKNRKYVSNTTFSEVKSPLWLKVLTFLGTTSTGLSIAFVAVGVTVYGLTVSAPRLWTQKYQNLQDLQKKERQFTFTDEMLKHKLAEEAKRADSGLVNPDPSKPPIFLPDTQIEPVQPTQPSSPPPKTVKPIFPVAY